MEILGGPLFGIAGAGESHGPAITTIVYGCPTGLKISSDEIQSYLDRRRPGGNRHGTPRNEKDRVVVLSGLYQEDHQSLVAGPAIQVSAGDANFESQGYGAGFTTGEPIAAIVLSTSNKSAHYDQFTGEKGAVRPGHTDLVKHLKSQGFVDVRGGGRSSYRSTISDVIGGSIARIYLQETFDTVILSSICQVGPLKAKRTLASHFAEMVSQSQQQTFDPSQISKIQAEMQAAEIHSFDSEFADEAAELIKKTRIDGDSLGAAVEVIAVNVPGQLGEPLYQSLKSRLMGTLGGLNAVQSCEIGDGYDVVSRTGSVNNDPIRSSGYQKNSQGGLIGGITTGLPLVARIGFKPTSTINKQQKSIRKNYENIDFELEQGRHDPCVGVRAGVTLESRMAIELLNAVLTHQAGRVAPKNFEIFGSPTK